MRNLTYILLFICSVVSGQVRVYTKYNNNYLKLGNNYLFDSIRENCVVFNGTSSVGTIADNDSLSFTDGAGNDKPFWISFWFYRKTKYINNYPIGKMGNSVSSNEWFIGSGNAASGMQLIMYKASSVTVYIGRYVSTAESKSLNKWQHWTIQYNGNEKSSGISIFLNGVRVDDQTAESGTYTGMANTTKEVTVGWLGYGAGNYANGYINDLRIGFNDTLNATEIDSIYRYGANYSPNNQFLWYPLTNNNLTSQYLSVLKYDHEITFSNITLQYQKIYSYNYYHPNSYLLYTYTDYFNSNSMLNSAKYGYNSGQEIRASFGIFDFTTNSNYLLIKANPTVYAVNPTYTFHQILIDINGVRQTQLFTSQVTKVINLGIGTKRVKLTEGATSKIPPATIGTFLTSVKISDLTSTNTNTKNYHITFLGNSITNGGNANNAAYECFTMLFRDSSDIDVTVLGQGYGAISQYASSAALITQYCNKIDSTLNGVDSNKVVIALGTNDYGYAPYSTDTTTFRVNYGKLIDSIHTRKPLVKVILLTPIIRSSEGNNSFGIKLDGYRKIILDLDNTRSSWCTSIECKNMLTTGDLDDGVHPTTAGHLKFYQALKPYLE